MEITTDIEGGNGEILWCYGDEAGIAVRADPGAGAQQWFHARVQVDAKAPHRLVVANAGACTYADAFEGYRACASYDGTRWFRVKTTYDGEQLVITHLPRARFVHYAYFAYYSEARRARVVRQVQRTPWARVERIGESVRGRPLDVLTFGEDDADLHLWLVARQHSGEAMAEWLAEGFVGRLFDDDDETVRAVLEQAAVHVVTCANPDGAALGHQRANAVGVDPNRAWIDPADAPEIAAIRAAMDQTGVDLFLDVHGDERDPYCFLAGCEGNPSYSSRLRLLESTFEQALCDQNPDFQDEHGYERDDPGAGDLRTAANWVGERYDCLSFTLEMPFKDNANAPDDRRGWSPERSAHLGHDALSAMAEVLSMLR